MKKILEHISPRLFIIPPIAIGVAFFIWMGKNADELEQVENKEIVTPAEVITLSPIDVIPRATGYGTAQPKNVWKAIAEVSGKVIKLYPNLKKGNFLKRGEEVIFIDQQKIRLQIAEIQASINSTLAEIKKLDIEEKNLIFSVKIEKKTLGILEKEWERSRKLVLENRVESASSLDKAEREFLAQQSKVQNTQNSIDTIPSQQEILKAQIALNRAKLSSAKLDLKNSVIRVPFNCRIDKVEIERGQFVQTGTLLIEAYGTDVSEVLAMFSLEKFRNMLSVRPKIKSVPDVEKIRNIVKIKPIIRLTAGNYTISWNEAYFSRINSEIDERSRMLGIVVALNKPYSLAQPGIRPPLTKGMFCEVELRGQSKPNCLVIPRMAIHDGKIYFVDKENRLRKRKVVIDFVQGDYAIVKSGLEKQQRIVVSDIIPAISGMLIAAQENKELKMKILRECGDVGEQK
ncbi:efflux RND transporter periplasmic adaptor subunit [Candidatus Uabimicrobium sp. HlEnr_7]|uniref:efflux RND transporter periplasmic adaptor subunit n=1 Tax=Candidatus Uabimicrobium helgolandensis TaxID=3095367 RepID=UPI003558C3F5